MSNIFPLASGFGVAELESPDSRLPRPGSLGTLVDQRPVKRSRLRRRGR